MTKGDRPVKRSLTLQGHRTSVSMEAVFWQEFQRLAETEGKSVNALAAEIDARRTPPGSLASAIRVYVLETLKSAS
jgi:predicted DNA-binding ribbon-helix-helix protein